MVAGYRRWQTLGRQVRKGEKAIGILAPVTRKDETDEPVVVAAGLALGGKRGVRCSTGSSGVCARCRGCESSRLR
ncbi:MAG: hypothetical protein GEU79_12690 [Acidimicrobiia bacterium]|nr:hypothetical protein [Acidimicrobiia bacterium]